MGPIKNIGKLISIVKALGRECEREREGEGERKLEIKSPKVMDKNSSSKFL
jgi:hypothetical protein